MCLANKFLTRFEELSNDMENEYKRLKVLRSTYDKKLSLHYHKMETMKFNAAEGYYLAKELQDIVRQRRVIKQELYKIERVRDKMKLQSIIDRSKVSRNVLNNIHKHEQSEEHYVTDFRDDYRVEDLVIH